MSADKAPTILVVDDNPASRYATTRILRAAGFSILEAGTGNEGLQLAPGADLVVLDVNLPDIDGFQVCRELRAKEHTARLPVIHLSATFVKDVHKVQGLDAGADGYLTHPVEPPVLIATVNAFLRTRRAEDAMRRSEAKFKAVFDQALSGISLLSRDLVYLEVNREMCRLLGRRREEVVGKHSSAFLPRGREEQAAEVARRLEANGEFRGEFPMIRSDGSVVELEWNISIHSVPGVRLAIATDVTNRKAAEAERERLLSSEQAARADAERANRLKDDFLATLSHELRTPLNAIVGWSQILKRGRPTPQDLAEGIDAIERNARAQADLISDLLDVSRITSGKLRLDVQSVDLAATVGGALEAVMPAAQAKDVRVDRALDPAAGPVWGDPSRLQQVVWNLVNNAVKFTPRGGRIQVRVDRVDAHARISVSDNGQGIKADFIPHLFERFRQEDATTRRNHGGLGLGLAIVKHLVEMHGGSVSAESPGEGLGSTFSVLLPLVPVRREPAPADESPPSVRRPAAGTGLSPCALRGVRVLVVDDDRDALDLLRRVLQDWDAEVMDAGDVRAALGALELFKPHVLISDIGMPREDGYDLIREVRARGVTQQQVPAIALTAFARTEDRRQALLSGYQVHLAKPVDANELLAAIASLVGRSGVGG